MELKLIWLILIKTECRSSNRTFMELKFVIWVWLGVRMLGSNRTFMELKLVSGHTLTLTKEVLIAPLWN